MAGNPIVVGAVAVDVVPSAKNFLAKLIKEIGPDASKSGGQTGKDFAEGFQKEAKAKTKTATKGILKEAASTAASDGEEAGDEWTSGFARRIRGTLESAVGKLPKLDVDIDFDEEGISEKTQLLTEKMSVLRDSMEALSGIDFTPDVDTSDYIDSIEAARAATAELLREGDTTIKVRSDVGGALNDLDNLIDGFNKVNAASGQFGRTLNSTVRGALTNLPDPEIDMKFDDQGVRERLAALRGELTDLSRLRVGLDVSDGDAVERLTTIRDRLTELADEDVTGRVRLDINAALKNIATLVTAYETGRDRIEEPIEPEVRLRQGRFATELDQIGERIAASVGNLREIRPDVDLAGWEAEFHKISGEYTKFVADMDLTPDADLDDLTRTLEEFQITFAAAVNDEDLTRETRRNAEAMAESLDGVLKDVRKLNGVEVSPDFTPAEINAGKAARELQSTIGDALGHFPDPIITIKDNSPQAQARYEDLVDQLRILDAQKVNVDVDYADAVEQLTAIRTLIRDLVARDDISVEVRVAGEEALERVDTRLNTIRDAELDVDVNGEPAVHGMTSLQAQMQSAMTHMRGLLGDGLKIDFDVVGQGRVELAELQALIQAFGDQTIGVDVDFADAVIEAGAVLTALHAIANMSDVEIEIKAEIKDAIGPMDEVLAKVKELRETEINLKSAGAERNAGRLADTLRVGVPAAAEGLGDIDLDKLGGPELDALKGHLEGLFDKRGKFVTDVESTVNDLDSIIAHLRDFAGDETYDFELRSNAASVADDLERLLGLSDKMAKEARQSRGGRGGRGGGRPGPGLGDVYDRARRGKPEDFELAGFPKALEEALNRVIGLINPHPIILNGDTTPINDDLIDIRRRAEDLILELKMGVDPGLVYRKVQAIGKELQAIARSRPVDFHVGVDTEAFSGESAVKEFEKTINETLGRDKLLQSSGKVAESLQDMWEQFTKMTPAAKLANAAIYAAFASLPIIISVVVVALFGVAGILVAIGAIAASLFAGLALITFVFAPIMQAIQEKQNVAKQAALRSAQDAQRELADNIARRGAIEAITDAEKALAQAKLRQSRAAKDLAKAEAKVTDARKDVADATKDAKTDLAKLNEEIRKNRIEQQKAIVTITQAREAYNRMLADPTASESDIEAGQAAYNKAEQDLRDLRAEQRKNEDEKGRYDRDGLKANAGYKSALDALQGALDGVTNAQESYADATTAVVDAQTALTRSNQSYKDLLQQQAAAAKTQAAQRKQELDSYNKLSESGKRFVDFWMSTVQPFLDELLKTAMDSGLLDGITEFFKGLISQKDSIKTLITNLGKALGLMFATFGQILAGPTGKRFLDFLAENLPKAIMILTELAPGLADSFVTILEKLAPYLDELVPGFLTAITSIAEEFAKWTATPEFQVMMEQMIKDMPKTIDGLVELVKAVTALLIILAPIADPITDMVLAITRLINRLDAEKIHELMKIMWVIGQFVAGITSAGILPLVLYIIRHLEEGIDNFKKTWEDTKKDIEDGLNRLTGVAQTFVTAIQLAFDGLDISLPVDKFLGMINKIISAVNRVGAPFDLHIDTLETSGEKKKKGGTLPRRAGSIGAGASGGTFATGGIVPGYQSSLRDEVPAMLRKGEGILVPEVVKQLGAATILNWNARGLRGRSIQEFAYGGLVDDIVAFQRKSGVPFNVTSGVRSTNDHHGRGMAVDTASTAANMQLLAQWLFRYAPYLLELIHSGGPGYFVKNGRKVTGDFYGPSVVAEHYNHVHTAINQAGLTNLTGQPVHPATFSGEGDGDGPGLFDAAASALTSQVTPLIDAFKAAHGDTGFGQMLARVPAKILDLAGTWLADKAMQLPGATVLSGAADTVTGLLSRLGLGDTNDRQQPARVAGVGAGRDSAISYAYLNLPKYGWDGSQAAPLINLWDGESNWRWNAAGAMTSLGRAYGIPQSLPGTKMAQAGPDWRSNAFTQIDWGLNYIKGRYGSPASAWAQWQARDPHWYDNGGYLPPGITLAVNGTGRPERVLTADQEAAMTADRGGLDITVRVQDGAVPGLVSAEVDRQFGSLADARIYGSV